MAYVLRLLCTVVILSVILGCSALPKPKEVGSRIQGAFERAVTADLVQVVSPDHCPHNKFQWAGEKGAPLYAFFKFEQAETETAQKFFLSAFEKKGVQRIGFPHQQGSMIEIQTSNQGGRGDLIGITITVAKNFWISNPDGRTGRWQPLQVGVGSTLFRLNAPWEKMDSKAKLDMLAISIPQAIDHVCPIATQPQLHYPQKDPRHYYFRHDIRPNNR